MNVLIHILTIINIIIMSIKDPEIPDWAQQAYEYLTGRGLSSVQASGIIGNIWHESGGDHLSRNKNSGAEGIMQWTGVRKKKMQEVYNTDHPTFEQQLEFLYDEHNGKYDGLGWIYKDKGKHNNSSGYYNYSRSEFNNALSPIESAVRFAYGYARPGRNEASLSKRIDYAQRAYSALADPDAERVAERWGDLIRPKIVIGNQ